MKRVRILAASDRNNYGDLLFPIIIKKYVEKEFDNYIVLNYGIIKSNLSDFGALPTESFRDLVKDLYKSDDDSIIIIGGGEVIGGGWLNIYRFLNPFWNKIYHNRYLRFLINKFKILETYNLYFNSSSRPFILDGKLFDEEKIFYNSVGAQGSNKLLSQKLRIQKYFKKNQYVSVRDKQSVDIFDKNGIRNQLVPDSAIIMSDLFSSELNNEVSNDCKEYANQKYIFLQFGNKKGPDELESFLMRMKSLAFDLNLKVLLCPIGLALDHGDDILLKEINRKYPELEYYHPKNLYEIMYLLKHSKFYMGTSLHGMITAQSYNVPFFVFPEKIPKLKVYIDTWFKNPESLYGSFEDWDKVRLRYTSFNSSEENTILEHQKNLVYNSFQIIFGNGKTT